MLCVGQWKILSTAPQEWGVPRGSEDLGKQGLTLRVRAAIGTLFLKKARE